MKFQYASYNRGVPKVTFTNLDKTVEFESGKLPYDKHGKPESILDVAIYFGITLDHACGGVCACTTCHVVVKSGGDNLTPKDEDEEDRLDFAPRPDPSIQARLPGHRQGRCHGGDSFLESQLCERGRRVHQPGRRDSEAQKRWRFTRALATVPSTIQADVARVLACRTEIRLGLPVRSTQANHG
jgi:ferredoxin